MMVDRITLGNGVTVTNGLDPDGMARVGSIATSWASANWSSGAYAYDGAGNVKSTGTLSFVYDKASRLTSGKVQVGTTTKTQTAVYDSFGNITSTTTTDWGTQTFSLSASTNRLNSPATYDAAGHLQHWGGSSYAYNAAGQLLTATGTGLNHTYLYTASGERIADRNALTNTTTLALRGLDGRILRLYSETGITGHGAMSWLEDQAWGAGRLLGTVSPTEGRRYYAADHLGTPRLACDRCAATKAQHAYYPFGLEATDPSQDAEPTRFTSQETDLQSTPGQADDLVNMHARFYHPTIARFLSADLLRGDPHSPQSFNLFAYVRGNPKSFWDPLGLDASQDPLNPFKWWDIIDVIGVDPWRIAAGGWQSRDEFMNGAPGSGLDGGGSGDPWSTRAFTAEWWNYFRSGTYWGTTYGQDSLDYYVSLITDPQSSWLQAGSAYVGAFFSSLWVPQTYYLTYGTFVAGASASQVFAENGQIATYRLGFHNHPAGPHAYPHVQLNWWRRGVSGSGGAWRLPW